MCFNSVTLVQDNNVANRDWQGVQSLPRAVALDEEQKVLRVRPAPQLKALRSAVVYQAKAEVDAAGARVGGKLKSEAMRAAGVDGLQVEVLVSTLYYGMVVISLGQPS